MALPALTNPLWQYSLQVYRRPGVEALCLRLQDDYSADVNLLLLNAWLIASGGHLPEPAWQQLLLEVAAWQNQVVKLRTSRRALKQFAQQSPELNRLYSKVKQLELIGEQYQQAIMWDFAQHNRIDEGGDWQVLVQLLHLPESGLELDRLVVELPED